MPMLNLKVNKLHSLKSFVSLKIFAATLIVAIGLAYILQIPSSIIFLIILIFLISPFMPSGYVLQKISLSVVFVVGLSPFYLLGRGFITEATLNRLDLPLYGVLIFLFVFLTKNKLDSREIEVENKFVTKRKQFVEVVSGCAGLIFGLLLEVHLLRQSLGNGVSWISSGDSKNHLLAGADLVRYGDLLPSTFLTQPINLPSTLSLLLSQIGSDLSSNPSSLGVQMKTYAFFWTVLIGFIGVAFSASGQILAHKNSISKLTLVMLSLIPFFSLILGPALNDGFFTAIFGIAALAVITNWYLEIQQLENPRSPQAVVGILIFMSTLMSWMFITAVTLLILLTGLRTYWKKFAKLKYLIDPAIFIFLTIAALFIHFSDAGQSAIKMVKVVLTATGAITTTKPSLYFALVLSIALCGILFTNQKNFGKSLLTIASLHLLGLIAFKFFSNLGLFSWNYYLLKYQWIMTASLLGLLAAIIFLRIENNLKINNRLKIYALAVSFLALLAGSEALAPEPASKVLPKILRGWENPRASIMDFALNQKLELKNPTMFFHYGYMGDARIANFWMNGFLDPQDPVRGWNYTIDTNGDPKQLCDVNAYYPVVHVITSDIKLEEELNGLCPVEEFEVSLVPPAL